MAEIHVQTKKHKASTAWIWILVILIIAAVLVYYFVVRNNKMNGTNTNSPNSTTSFIQFPHTSFYHLT